MSYLVSFFQSIAGLIVSLVNFFIDGINAVISLIDIIPKYISYVYGLFTLLPGVLQTFLFIVFIIMILWLVRSIV